LEDVMEEPRSAQAKPRPERFVGLGVAIGAGVGVAIGTVLGNVAVGLAVGVGVGIALGWGLIARERRQDRE
jgi:hypothetical protein